MSSKEANKKHPRLFLPYLMNRLDWSSAVQLEALYLARSHAAFRVGFLSNLLQDVPQVTLTRPLLYSRNSLHGSCGE